MFSNKDHMLSKYGKYHYFRTVNTMAAEEEKKHIDQFPFILILLLWKLQLVQKQ